MVLRLGNKELSGCGASGLSEWVRVCVCVCVIRHPPGGRGPSYPTGVGAHGEHGAAGGRGVQVLAAACRGATVARAAAEPVPAAGLPGGHMTLVRVCVCENPGPSVRACSCVCDF